MRYLFNFAFLIFPVILLAQSETTIEEYKYLTKGYAYQKEMGLDGIKEGYDLKKLFTASNGVEFRSLIKGESEIKGVLVILNVDSKSPIYLGLPTNNSSSELKGQAENDANGELSLNDKVKYDHAILEFVMFQLDGGVAKRYLGDAKKNVKASSVLPVEVIDEEYSKIIPLQIDKSEQMTEGSGAFNAGIVNINNNVVTQNNFNGRSLIQPPVVLGKVLKSGTVVVKMCIDIKGNVKTAKFTQKGSTTFDRRLRNMALKAAKQAKFSKGVNLEECGTITFNFK